MAFMQILKSICLSQCEQLSQMEERADRTTFQATWLSLAKWLPTARFISGSSVLFTLFNCLTVPVYAVSLPILSASIKRQSFPSINEQHLGYASSRAAGCDQTKCGCPASCRRHCSHILELRRGQSTLKALFVWRVCTRVYVCACIFMCVSELLSIPLQPVGFYQTSQSGRPDGESVEPLKSVINTMVKGTCMGSDPGSLL